VSASDAFVREQVPRDQYIASDGQTIFDYNFVVFDSEDIVVLVTKNPNTENASTSQLAEGSDYVVNNVGEEDGGTIELISGGADDGDRYTIYRDTDIERLTDILQSGSFRSSTVNIEYDTIYTILQEIALQLQRGMTLPQELPIDELILPGPLEGDSPGIIAWEPNDDDLQSLSLDELQEQLNNLNDVSEWHKFKALTNVNLDGNLITNLHTPESDSDAANKGYVDDQLDLEINNISSTMVFNFPTTELSSGNSVSMFWKSPSQGDVTITAMGAIGSTNSTEVEVLWDSTSQKITTSTREEMTLSVPNSTELEFRMNNTTNGTITSSGFMEINT